MQPRATSLRICPPRADARLRLLLTGLLLFSLVFQAFIFANHFDGTSVSSQIGHAQSDNLVNSGGKGQPSKDDGSCLICHQIAQAGQFVTPSVSTLLPPVMAVSVIALFVPLTRAITASSHSWQGRAPPSA